ncbi:MAG: aminotransferase class I/II-fold pyridoxal phosphate-dependent enzyme [Alphaproteobacteria bacterium]|nr:aminotransferase class I/II-fold pyridoxal phosphate-dependent enzyme [Alphaproteobacteria bacterium]
MADKKYDFATDCIHAGQEPDPITGAVNVPIYMTSTYAQDAPAEHKGFVYARGHNPTRYAFERAIAALEEGVNGYAFASGMAATATVLELLPAGSHIIACDDLYGGTYRLFERVRKQSMGLEVTYIDIIDKASLERAIKPNTKMIWVESPTNPLLKVIDLKMVASFAKEKGLIAVTDNTFATPYFQRPLTLGFDIVVHSVTKYLGGHSDMIGGAVVMREAGEMNDRIKFMQNAIGGILGPFESFLALRGLKTLAVRMDRHDASAKKIVAWLKQHKKVEKVYYPGYGGMISFVAKATLDDAKKMLSRAKVFTLAESLGGVESLIEHPGLMTHASIPAEQRKAIGIDDGLIRVSVGLEAPEDLIADLGNILR